MTAADRRTGLESVFKDAARTEAQRSAAATLFLMVDTERSKPAVPRRSPHGQMPEVYTCRAMFCVTCADIRAQREVMSADESVSN